AIDGDIAAGHFGGQGLAHADQAGFGGAVIGLTGVASGADDRADVDDAAKAALHHHFDGGAGQAESGSQVHVDDVLPGFVGHTHRQGVAGETRIVNQNVDSARSGFGFGHDLVGGLGGGQVANDHKDTRGVT